MKKIASLFFCIFSLVFLVSCGRDTNEKKAYVTLKIVEVESLEDAMKVAGFNIGIPSYMFNDSYEVMYRAEPEKLIEIRYRGMDEQVIIRKAKGYGMEDISGDYNEYPEVETKEVNKSEIIPKSKGKDEKIKIVSKGIDDKINVVYWNIGDYSYSISINPGGIGYSKDKVKEMFLNIN